jgi:hypothetical protein
MSAGGAFKPFFRLRPARPASPPENKRTVNHPMILLNQEGLIKP